jgi:ketopantoate hydroxymethyltransferase
MTAAGLGGIIDFMQDLGFEAAVIIQVEEILFESEDVVRGARKVDQIADISFGDVQEGVELAGHTQKARDAVREALLEMVNGLVSYREGLTTLVQRTGEVEDETVSALRRITPVQEDGA